MRDDATGIRQVGYGHMQPIAELDAAVARALRVVVFDIDDTLTRAGRVEEHAFTALWQLQAAGLKLIAVTGRPIGFAEIVARTWPVDAAVGENGAGFIRVTASGLEYGFYAGEAERERDAQLLARVRARVEREAPFAQITDDSWARRCDLAWDINERVHLNEEQVAKLRALIEAEGARCVTSSVHAHAMTANCDKASGARLVAREVMGIDLDQERERWLFVGDSGNDAAAFTYFPISAGVANVRKHLHALPVPPRFVSVADHGLGFAEIAARVIALRSA
jgi:HAD superfamily hydrolase (TIGR01484 family)